MKVSFHMGFTSLSFTVVWCHPFGAVLMNNVRYGSGVSTENDNGAK